MPAISKKKQKKLKREDRPFRNNMIIHKDIKKHDILLGRGKARFTHPGNLAYRAFIESRMEAYFNSKRQEKSEVVIEIVRALHNFGSRFLKKNEKESSWQEIDSKWAREKVGHSIRDTAKKTKNGAPYFPYQKDMQSIFDSRSKYEEILDYVLKKSDEAENDIPSQERKQPQQNPCENYTCSKLSQNNPTFKGSLLPHNSKICMSKDISLIYDYDFQLMNENEKVSILDEKNDFFNFDSNDDGMPQLKPEQSSTIQASIMNNFVSKLDAEAATLGAIDYVLKKQPSTSVDNFCISLTSPNDWLEFDKCSKHSDDQWSEHLVSLVSDVSS